MSLYNMLFGQNPQSDLLLAVIGFRKVDVERFRDVSVEEDGKTIAIYTRTGGGNRSDYPQVALCQSPHFRSTEDDDFDNTYATFYFDTPEAYVDDVKNLSDVLAHGIRPEFAQHVAKTLRREPTEDDIARAAYDAEAASLARLRGVQANGHTFVPYCDSAMEGALKLAEANGGELRSAWGILPLKLRIVVDERRELRPGKDGATYIDWNRAEISYQYRWEIDADYWKHCRERFATAYPKAMAKIAEDVARQLSRAA